MKQSKDFNIRQSGDNFELEIAECLPEDSGTYTCEAFNDSGETFSTGTILVKGNFLLIIFFKQQYFNRVFIFQTT